MTLTLTTARATNYVERQMPIETEPEPEPELEVEELEEPELEQEELEPGYNDSQTLSGHSRDVSALALDQDTKTLYSGSLDMTVKVWTM